MKRYATLLIILVCSWICSGAENHRAPEPSDSNRFEYRKVRGREAKGPLDLRYEGEVDLALARGARPQEMRSFGDQWSGNAHLLWDGAIGDSFESSIDLSEAGTYDLSFQLTVAPDYGKFEVTVNDRVLAQEVDLYRDRVDLLKPIIVEDVELTAGSQRVSFKLVGHNDAARPYGKNRYLLGLDCIQLIRKDLPPVVTVDSTPEMPRRPPKPIPNPLSSAQLNQHLEQYCYQCHQDTDGENDLDLTQLTNAEQWLDQIQLARRVRNVLERHEMPPSDEDQPEPETRQRMLATFDSYLKRYLSENPATTPVVMRRLNRYEYSNAVRDLLELKGDIYPLPEKTIRGNQPYFEPASGRFPRAIMVGNRTLGKNQVEKQILTGVSPFAIDLQAEGGFNNRGSELSFSPILLESFLKLGQSIVSSPEFTRYCESHEKLFTISPEATINEQATISRERLQPLLERAFRQRIDAATLDRYHGFFLQKLATEDSFETAMKDTVAAILASPRFIYLVESAPNEEEEQSLTGYELAARLAMFLWSSIPDEALLKTARDGSILQAEVLDQQVQRMLEDPRCQALSQNFARQWMRLDQLVTAVPDFDRYPEYYARIGCEQWKFGLQTMIEPLLLFESIMVEDRSILLLIDSDYTYRSDELQSWYTDAKPFSQRQNRNRFNTNQQVYRRRQVKDRREGGVITSAATLTMTSSPLRTSPIRRGSWVATVVFNQPPPPPPDEIPSIEEDDESITAQGLTLRERLVQHQVNPSCVSCHAKIDPLGFALENYDAVGRWRDQYHSGLEIDASGELFGQAKFQDAVGLKDAILDHPEWFIRAFAEHLLCYAISREIALTDRPSVDEIVDEAIRDQGQFSTIVRSIVKSRPFRLQAVKESSKGVQE